MEEVIPELEAALLQNYPQSHTGSDSSSTDGSGGTVAVPRKICRHPLLPEVVLLCGSGPHAIDYGGAEKQDSMKEVVVSRKCGEAVLRGAEVIILCCFILFGKVGKSRVQNVMQFSTGVCSRCPCHQLSH